MSFLSIKKNGDKVEVTNDTETEKDIPLTPSGHVDVEEIVRRHNVVEMAEKDGENEIPTSDLTERTASERGLDDLMHRYVNRFRDKCVTTVNNIDTAFGQTMLEAKEALHKVKLAAVVTDTNSLLDESDQTRIGHARKVFTKAHNEFEKFKLDNHLVRSADKVPEYAGWIALLLGVIFVVVEGVINASIFSSNLDGGLFAGFMYAAILSAVNIILASSFGYGARYSLCPGKVRWLGRLSGLLAIVVVYADALLIAHFREALAIDDENAPKLAIESLANAPYPPLDTWSIVLFVATIFFGIFAIVDVWTYKDSFPGYHEKTLKYQAALKVWTKVCDTYRTRLDEKKDKYLKTFDDNIQKLGLDIVHLERRLNDKQAELTKYQRAQNNAETALRSLVGKYREANRLARTTNPPAYFGHYEDLDYPKLDPISCTDLDEQRAELKQLIDDFEMQRKEALDHKAIIIRRFNDEKNALLTFENQA